MAKKTRKVAPASQNPADDHDRQLLANVEEPGWYVIGIEEDEEGPAFAYSGVAWGRGEDHSLVIGVAVLSNNNWLAFFPDGNSPHRQMCLSRRCGLLAGKTKPISTLDRVSLFEFAGDRPVQGWIAPRSVEAEFRADDRFRHCGTEDCRLLCLLSWIRFAGESAPAVHQVKQFLCRWLNATQANPSSHASIRTSGEKRI